MIKNINNYIKQFNANAAKTIKANIIKSIKKLADFPYSSRQGRVLGTRELVIQDTAYNAVFRVSDSDSDIEILTIHNSSGAELGRLMADSENVMKIIKVAGYNPCCHAVYE